MLVVSKICLIYSIYIAVCERDFQTTNRFPATVYESAICVEMLLCETLPTASWVAQRSKSQRA